MDNQTKETAMSLGIKYGNAEGQKKDLVPYERIRRVISEIEGLKKKTERVASFFPLWADDECFQHLHDKTHCTMRYGLQEIGETGQKKMLKEGDSNEGNKTELKMASLNHLMVEGPCRDDIRAFVFGIIERACAKVQEDIRTSQQEQLNLASEKNFNSSIAHAYVADFDNHSDQMDHLSQNQRILMVKVMQELKEKTYVKQDYLIKDRQPVLSVAQSIADNHDCNSVSSLTVAETLKLENSVTEIRVGFGTVTEATKPAQPRLAQYVFLCTTGIPPPEHPCDFIEKKSGWRARLRRFFGCLG